MKNFLVALLILLASISSPAQQLKGQIPVGGMQPVKNFLLPFQSDGCTGWIDKVGAKDYTSCCLEHDIRYWIGGTEEQKLQTDRALKECVNKVFEGPNPRIRSRIHIMGPLMFIFVYMWGKLDAKDVTRWANGWNYLRDRYQPVTEEEKAEAAAMTPPDLMSAARKYWTKEQKKNTKIEKYNAQPYPTVLGDYCLDEVAGKLSRKVIELGKSSLHMIYQPDEVFPNTYLIQTDLCPEPIRAKFKKINHISECEAPVWGIRPSDYLKSLDSYGECEKLLQTLER